MKFIRLECRNWYQGMILKLKGRPQSGSVVKIRSVHPNAAWYRSRVFLLKLSFVSCSMEFSIISSLKRASIKYYAELPCIWRTRIRSASCLFFITLATRSLSITDLIKPYLDWGGGKMSPLRVFAEYLRNAVTDLYQTLHF